MQLMHAMRLELAVAGVPAEAWPQRLPKCRTYTLRRGDSAIQAFMLRAWFCVPRGRNPHLMIFGEDIAAEAWERTKRIGNWEQWTTT